MPGLVLDPDADVPVKLDESKKVISVELPDGGIDIYLGALDGDNDDSPDDADEAHDANLALTLDEYVLSRIAADLLEGIEDDDNSRADWLNMRAEGMRLLGLSLEKPGEDDAVKGMSKITHPLLLEAILRFQANARAELLATDGPVKIHDDDTTPVPDEFAEAYERDFNHYLTTIATEYYPDTDKMLFWVGFGGIAFKKVYHDPIRMRPVSEMVDAADVIVSNDTVDLQNASRITHKIKMRSSVMKRMQLVGAYRDIGLVAPDVDTQNPVEEETSRVQGLAQTDISSRYEDRDRTVYECYCELDLEGYEHEDAETGEMTGLPLPYKVTIDKSDRTILEIRRNWKEDDETSKRQQVFVPFLFAPGPGFYGIGLLHILGNATSAATAAWRIMLDAGMRANFPGGLIDKRATRQNRTDFRAGLGEFVPVESGGEPISNMIMPFPFKGPDQTTMALVENIVDAGQRVGGTAEMSTGEGRQDAPVGTTLALIEQAGKILDAVHKRMHSAQSVEFQLLADKFREDPETFWKFNRKPMLPWDKQVLLYALNNCDLTPVADPNTSSHVQRMAKVEAVQQLVLKLGPMAPMYFDLGEVIQWSFEMWRIPNYARLMNPNQPPPGAMPPQAGKGAGAAPDPAAQQAQLQDAATKQFTAQQNAMRDQARAQLDAKKADNDHIRGLLDLHQKSGGDPNAGLAAHVDIMDAETRRLQAMASEKATAIKHMDVMTQAQQQAADRESELAIAKLSTAKELAIHNTNLHDAHIDRQHRHKTEEMKIKAMAKARSQNKPKRPK